MCDHTGVFAVCYNGATYYHRKDVQGNVIAILDNAGVIKKSTTKEISFGVLF